ncbi:MAG: galactokinase [bacterium]
MAGVLEQKIENELPSIYNCSAQEASSHLTRYRTLLDLYRRTYGEEPSIVVRAPGRVNLIGEHTDYNGYPVLPMAVDRDIIFVLGPSKGNIIDVANEHPAFEPRSFSFSLPVPPFAQGDWGNYVKAAVQGLLSSQTVKEETAVGFRAVVGGNVPESAGLSSSSALTVASALSFLVINNAAYDRVALAELLAKSERYVGMEGGGMDQAISLLGQEKHALKIDFFPLRTKSIPVPSSLVFVVCYSLVRSAKSENTRYHYNRRVVEGRIATALISKAVLQNYGKQVQAKLLAHLSSEALGISELDVDQLAYNAIGESPLSLEGVAARLGMSAADVEKNYTTLQTGATVPPPSEGFKVWQRYRHVTTEARRVEKAVIALEKNDIAEFGRLMNDSHESCRDDYEVSCQELDALVLLARSHGALGARLTGAGFGGCTVNAVPTAHVEQFVQRLTQSFYQDYAAKHGLVLTGNLNDAIFPCRPTRGACVVAHV